MIVRYPDPILTHPAAEVTAFGPVLETLVAGMIRILEMARGAGLAAPQIGASLRVAIVRIPEKGYEGKEKVEFPETLVLVNPLIMDWSDDTVLSQEGCLSAPGIAGIVERRREVTVRAQNEKGEWFEKTVDGVVSCIVQHELDHLHGRMFWDHLGPVKRDLLLTRYRKIHKREERTRKVAGR
jgi:peptide deformylase